MLQGPGVVVELTCCSEAASHPQRMFVKKVRYEEPTESISWLFMRDKCCMEPP